MNKIQQNSYCGGSLYPSQPKYFFSDSYPIKDHIFLWHLRPYIMSVNGHRHRVGKTHFFLFINVYVLISIHANLAFVINGIIIFSIFLFQDNLMEDMSRVQGIWDDELSSIIEISKVEEVIDQFRSNLKRGILTRLFVQSKKNNE